MGSYAGSLASGTGYAIVPVTIAYYSETDFISGPVGSDVVAARAARAYALLDTGAEGSGVDATLAVRIGLRKTGETRNLVSSVAPGGRPSPIYSGLVGMEATGSWKLKMFEFIARRQNPRDPNSPLLDGYEMLIGNDLLGSCMFVVDGPAGQFNLSYDGSVAS